VTTKAKESGITTEDVAAIIAPGIPAEDPGVEEPGVEAAPEKTRPSSHIPRFGMCEGTREELERTGKSIDPFTGVLLTRDDLKE